MAAIGLVGLAASLGDVIEAALKDEGHTVARIPLDVDTVRTARRIKPDVLVLDGHAYVNTGALIADLRARPETRTLPVVVLGRGGQPEVALFEAVHRLGRSFNIEELLQAVRRASRPPIE